MDLGKEAKQRDTFRNLLFELAKDQKLLQDKQERVNMYMYGRNKKCREQV